jgi:hypothetical protein
MGFLFPKFSISKKNRTIKNVTDFRKPTLLLKRRISPISYSTLRDMIRSMEGFSFQSAFDKLNMGYYHIKLDYEAYAQNLCTNEFQWGNYKYKLF